MVPERKIAHTHLDCELESVLLLPEGTGPFPAVLLVHEYTGLNDVIMEHGRRLAGQGYAVLVADFYGPGNRPSSIDEARAVHRIYRDDRLLMRARAAACLEVLLEQQGIDPGRTFAMGFSFGGGAVLELARTGTQLSGAVSVYGYLDTSHPVSAGEIKCPLLAAHVNNDPVVPAEHAEMFIAEMDSAGVDYELLCLDDACHGFANPNDSGFDAALAEKMWHLVLEWMRELN